MRLWIAAAALIALAAIILVVVPYAVDWERYRPDIEVAATRLSGHDVTIKGPIDVAILPRPALTARDIKMTSRPDAPIGFALSAQQVDIDFHIGLLLIGHPTASRLRLNRPRLIFDQKTSSDLKSWPPKFEAWPSLVANTELPMITIIEGGLGLSRDDEQEQSLASGLSLTIAKSSTDKPLEAAGLFKTDHHRFKIATELGAADRDGASTVKVRIDAQNGVKQTTTLNLNGVVRRQGQDAGLSGRIDLAGPDLRRGLQAISAVSGYPSTFLSLAENQSFRLQSRLRINEASLRTEETKISIGGKFGSGEVELQFEPRPNLNLTLDLPTIHLADETALIDFLPLDLLSVLPTTPGKIGLQLRDVTYRDHAVRRAVIAIVTDRSGLPRIEQARAQLPGLVDVQFNGLVRPSETGRTLSGRLSAVGDDLGATIRWLGLPLVDQSKGWRSFSLESKLDINNVEMALADINMRLDTSKISGRAGLRFSDRLDLGLDLDIERLNLDLYAADQHGIDAIRYLGQNFAWLDSSIDARFKNLSWKGLRLNDMALSATVEQQHFKLTSLSLETVGDTAMTLEGEIDLETEAVDLTAELRSEAPTRALRHLRIGLPLASTRLEPVAMSGWITGRLNGFDIGLKTDYDDGQWLVEGRAGWIDEQPHYDLNITADHPDHLALAGHFGLAPLVPANDAPGPFMLSGQLRHDPEGSWVVAGNAKLGPSSITGRLTHQEDASLGNWDAKVSLGNPQKDSLAPIFRLAGLRATGDWTPRSMLGRLPQIPLRTAWLDDFDGSLSLVAKGGLAGDGLELLARLDQGFFYVEDFGLSLWNGKLDAELSLEQRREQPFLSLAAKLDGVDADVFTGWLGLTKTIDGPLDLDLEATSVGHTIADLIKGISGQLSIEAGPGRLIGATIPTFRKTIRDRSRDDLRNAPRLDDPLIMPLSTIKTKGRLDRGIVTFEEGDLTFDPGMNGDAKASITGTLDLVLWVAELVLDVSDEDANFAPFLLKIVGSPNRPQSLVLEQE